eukprot:145661-Chlamydomonas_euryale.AAC.1
MEGVWLGESLGSVLGQACKAAHTCMHARFAERSCRSCQTAYGYDGCVRQGVGRVQDWPGSRAGCRAAEQPVGVKGVGSGVWACVPCTHPSADRLAAEQPDTKKNMLWLSMLPLLWLRGANFSARFKPHTWASPTTPP